MKIERASSFSPNVQEIDTHLPAILGNADPPGCVLLSGLQRKLATNRGRRHAASSISTADSLEIRDVRF